jgi:hypothetical protein
VRTGARADLAGRLSTTDERNDRMIATSFGEFLAWMIYIFLLVMYFMILFQCIGDLFRRHDDGAFKKILWILFWIGAPFLGLFIYIIVNHDGMQERALAEAKKNQEQFNSYVQSVAATSGSADQIAKAKELLDAGTISQEEFDQIKAKALA